MINVQIFLTLRFYYNHSHNRSIKKKTVSRIEKLIFTLKVLFLVLRVLIASQYFLWIDIGIEKQLT
jgi:hypothetical protein